MLGSEQATGREERLSRQPASWRNSLGFTPRSSKLFTKRHRRLLTPNQLLSTFCVLTNPMPKRLSIRSNARSISPQHFSLSLSAILPSSLRKPSKYSMADSAKPFSFGHRFWQSHSEMSDNNQVLRCPSEVEINSPPSAGHPCRRGRRRPYAPGLPARRSRSSTGTRRSERISRGRSSARRFRRA